MKLPPTTLPEAIESIKWNLENDAHPKTEAEVIKQVVDVILRCLGWDVSNDHGRREVKYEHHTNPGNVDIALIRPTTGRVMCVVEAKHIRKKLDSTVEKQLITYIRKTKAKFGVLTNGREWEFYIPKSSKSHTGKRFLSLDLTKDSEEQLAIEFDYFLSRKNILADKVLTRAKTRLKTITAYEHLTSSLPSAWISLLREPDSNLVEQIAKRLEIDTKLKPTSGHLELILQITSDAYKRFSWHDTVKINEASKRLLYTYTEPKQSVRKSRTKQRSVSFTPELKYFTLWNKRHAANTYRYLFICTVRLLYKKHGNQLLRTVNQGWIGSSPPIVSKKVLDGHNRIPNCPWYVLTVGNAAGIVRRAQKLLDAAGEREQDIRVFDTRGREIFYDQGKLILK